MRLKMFVVFHKAIDERLIFQPFAASEIDDYFALYAVNEKFPGKRVTKANGQTSSASANDPHVVLEYGLGWYDPTLQSRGFMETSCYVHLMRNDLHLPFDYIGVTQYDMRWREKGAAALRALADRAPTTDKLAYGFQYGTLVNDAGEFHPLAFTQSVNWEFLIASYNRFFNQRLDVSSLIGKPLTLFQTYLLPRSEFVALAQWLEVLCGEVYPWANQPPYPAYWGALSGYMERAEALFIAARLHEEKLTFCHLPLQHDASIPVQLGVSKDHYGRTV